MINAITDEAGERHGFVVQWDNVSERNRTADIAVREVLEATTGIAASVDESAATADHNAGNAQTAAAATEELRSAVADISRSTTASAELVRRAVAATKDGVEKLRDLESAGREIGEFLRLITGLAEQTKMLALNANIEAARAGDAGRGFAVVADEVKNLAGTTAASITDIESRIHAIQDSTSAGFAALAEIEQLVDKIDESHATVAAAIEEQSAVTAEIARAVAEIADSARTNTEVLARVTDAVNGMSDQAQALHSLLVSS